MFNSISNSSFLTIHRLICSQCNYLSIPIENAVNVGRAIGCECDAFGLLGEDVCTLDDKQSGTCTDVICKSTCSKLYMPTSMDHSTCTVCGNENDSTNVGYNMIEYHSDSGDCRCDNPLPASSPGSKRLLNRKLVEIYDSITAEPIRKECAQCPVNTAVITRDLLISGDEYYMTAGIKYSPNPYDCVHCPDPNMYFNTNYQCKCKDGYMVVGEASIGAQKCIKHTPTLSSDYERVQFRFIREVTGSQEEYQITLNSITFSHFYLEAASLCEFATGYSLERSLNGCQTLANLCVMTYYDNTSTPCRQFQSIIAEKRSVYYHDQTDWKIMMPWLYYTDEVDDIVEDKSIRMSMSLKAQGGNEHFMMYKLAKYTIGGEFLGIEDLANQFMYCMATELEDFTGMGTGLKFGDGFTRKFQCDLKSLLNSDMYFYDLFLLDKQCTGKEGDECLYPVPVLNRNFVEGGDSLPNRNQFFGDELDDRYTRRFFLLDNMSGKEDGGLKVIRYASKITLQTTIQSHTPGKIYPPKLIIEYDEREILPQSEGDEYVNILFQSEYTMMTKKFWATVEVLSGFVSALTFVIWIFRVYNSHTQHRNLSIESEDTNLCQFFIHALMIGIHSFVAAFFPFILLLCLYWYIFIKLQDTVFLLLPPANQYEYLFYTFFIHCLCWGQSIYVSYIIFKQCQIDLFFVDWERLKGTTSSARGVSMWRTVMIGNEFNKMQYTRKSSIEINLVSLILLMGNNTSSITTKNTVMGFAENCLIWFLVASVQGVFRFVLYERYYTEPKGQRFIDLCTLAKISIFVMDERYHGYYLHCRSPYEFADCAMDKICCDMGKEASGTMISRGLDSPGCPLGCQTFELFTSEAFQTHFRKPFLSSVRTWSRSPQLPTSEKSLFMKAELHSFLISFIEQSPPPQQEGLKYIVREPMTTDKILRLAPDNRSKDSPCILYPDQVTWAHDYSFLSTTFLGIEFQLLLHDILIYNMVDLFLSGSPYLSVSITYFVHLVRLSVRRHFGSKNLSQKTFLDERFIQ